MMNIKHFLSSLILLVAMFCEVQAQSQPEAYRLYDAEGNAVAYDKMIAAMAKADVTFVGEIHNCAITHWMELKMLEAVSHADAQQHQSLAVGMEMLEADNQLIINEYLQGIIGSDKFEAECRLWDNYSTDYEPLVYYAKANHLPVIATNVPRRYASVVKDHGLSFLDSLSVEAKSYLPPLPIKYVKNEEAKAGFEMMKLMSGKAKNANADFMSQAQAIKDATMAWHIAQTLKQRGGHLVHFNGAYHSDARNGIIPYLLQYRPGTTTCVVRSVRQDEIKHLDSDYIGLADFYIVIPEDMSMSY